MELDEKTEKAENKHLLNGDTSCIDTHASGPHLAGLVYTHDSAKYLGEEGTYLVSECLSKSLDAVLIGPVENLHDIQPNEDHCHSLRPDSKDLFLRDIVPDHAPKHHVNKGVE